VANKAAAVAAATPERAQEHRVAAAPAAPEVEQVAARARAEQAREVPAVLRVEEPVVELADAKQITFADRVDTAGALLAVFFYPLIHRCESALATRKDKS
jgi:hypothetical protein